MIDPTDPFPDGSPCSRRIKTPGNFSASPGPSLTGVPPMVIQNFLFASTSFTSRCNWPMATPASFGAGSCAHAVLSGSTATRLRMKISFFIRILSSQKKQVITLHPACDPHNLAKQIYTLLETLHLWLPVLRAPSYRYQDNLVKRAAPRVVLELPPANSHWSVAD